MTIKVMMEKPTEASQDFLLTRFFLFYVLVGRKQGVPSTPSEYFCVRGYNTRRSKRR